MTAASTRRDDARLAWAIVGGSALVSLLVICLLLAALRGPAMRWADAQWRRAEAEAARQRQRIDEADAGYQVYTPATPPPNDATPVGDPARWVGPDTYPPYALRHGQQGRVRVTLAIDAAGVPTGCSIAQSSGHWSLDNGTCLAMMRVGRFDRAAKGRSGVRHWTSPGIVWRF